MPQPNKILQTNQPGLAIGDWQNTSNPTTPAPQDTYGAAAPTAGTWAKGDRCWNTGPTATGTLLWICTTAGTPGTWTAVAIP